MKQHANNEGIRLKNWSTGEVLYDTLHSTSNVKALNCRSTICTANHMNTIKEVKPIRTGDAVLDDAKKFIDEFYASIEKFGSAEHLNRWSEIKTQIEESDGYIMKTEELKYGATVAWRNAPRCPGRIQWKKLQVFDSRHVGTAQGMFEAMCTHLQYATNGGILRSAITVFPPRQKGRCDFRVWNSTMIGYACYKQPDGTLLGDPFNLELTQAAQKLGWAGKGTRQDILPLIVQAGDGEAHFFDIPEDLVLQVPLRHPKYEKFTDLGYKWFALPGVSCLKLDCGGLEFSAIPFSGWYSDSEIGSRDLGDKHRFNLAPVMAGIMGLNTETNESNWRDLAVSELVVAVAHSFREAKITIVDHQTACETFIEHFKSEHEERGGCPTDWVWVNPPGSFTTPVYHQEVLFYWIKPLYDYQDQPWKTYNFGKHFRGTLEKREIDYLKRFRHMARAALFAQRMFMKAYANRTKAMILYATETGKSLGFAKQLAHVFSKAFKPEVMCMKDYDVAKMEFQDLILVVASTFGSGDPPDNGEKFYKSLKKRFVEQGNTPNIASDKPARLAARIQAQEGERNMRGPLVKLPSQRFEDPAQIVKSSDWLINVRFSCFALGSTVYKDYCAFGKALDALLGSLGAERIHRLECGDEMSGQEKTFKKWANDTFQAACEAFHIKLPTKAVVTIGTESVQEPVQSNMKLVSADASEGPHFTEYSFAVMRKYIWKFHQKCCGLLIRMILLATVISLVSTKQIAREKADPLTIYHNFVPLGRGGYGAVFKAQDKFTNETVAIKIVDVEQPHRSSEKIYREVEALAKLQSPYFPKFYGSYRRDQKLWIIMEFINGSSAMDLMMRGPVDEFYIRIILREVLKGINYLHSNNLIHRDIKAANILIGGNGEVKIGDLGGIIEATDSQWISGQDTMYGTQLWLSPEQLFNSRYNKKVDIWSLGITAIELSQREPPFFRQPEMEFIEHMSDVFLGGDYKLDYKFTMDFHNFIKRCLIGNPHRRPSAEELLNDPFIKGSSDKQYLKSLLIQNHDFRGEL